MFRESGCMCPVTPQNYQRSCIRVVDSRMCSYCISCINATLNCNYLPGTAYNNLNNFMMSASIIFI